MSVSKLCWLLAATSMLALCACSEDESPESTGGGGAGGQGPDPTLDPGIISANDASMREAESTIAVAPDGRLVIAWIGLEGFGASHIGYVFSTDRGETWEPIGTIHAPGGGPTADPVLAVDADGSFYLVWLAFAATAQDHDHIYLSRAAPGATEFEPPVEVTDPNDPAFYDKPHVSITGAGTILVTYTRQVALIAARSTDGQTWTRSVIVNEAPTRNHVVATCAAAGGSRVWATHLHYADIALDRQAYLRWSDDDGQSWPAGNVTVVSAADETDTGVDDPSCVAEGDDVWVVYGRTHDTPTVDGFGNLYAIRVAHSSDGGQTVQARHDAHDAAAAPYYLHPRLVRDDQAGLDLVYYTGNDEGDEAGAVRLARSVDGAASFAPSEVIHEPVTFLQARGVPKWIGEYFGVAWRDGNLHVAYIDNSGSASHVAFYRTAVP